MATVVRNIGFVKALLERNILDGEQLTELRTRFQENDAGLCRHIIASGIIDRETAGELWSTGFGLAWMPLQDTLFQQDIVARLPRSFADKHKIIPIYKFGDRVTCAVANPTDRIAIDKAEYLIREKLSLVCSFIEDVSDAIEIQYGSVDGLLELSEQVDLSSIVAGGGWGVGKEELERIAGEKAIIELVRAITLLGIKEKASDIHISPGQDHISVRFRVDGVLQERLTLALDVLPALTARVKVITELDLAEHRRPQDGRTQLDLASRSVDIRVSVVPTVQGERVVMRLLTDEQAQGIPELADLEFSARNLKAIKRLSRSPSGVVFVVGPTGSGKTTTLFSILQEINTPDRNVLTIEDPVEYKLDGAGQLQVNSTINLSFESALRAFLRQDPDVILVGEIRDIETAEIALRAGLTGHLVFSSMHTNDALQAVMRLMDFGVDNFNVAAPIAGILYQRLVRRLCSQCKQPYVVNQKVVEELFEADGEPVTFYRAKGCPVCNYQGYKGRLAVHELFMVDDAAREVINRGGEIKELQKVAERSGMQSFTYDGLKKVLRGLTSLEELRRVSGELYLDEDLELQASDDESDFMDE